MFWQLAQVFINVIVPVFALVIIGYVAGPRLELDARTLSRMAYYLLVPCFTFNILTTSSFEVGILGQMLIYILLVVIGTGTLGFFVARMLRRPAPVIAAYILVAVFGNVGNFGLPLLEFRFGPEALVPATVYFLAMSLSAFAIGVAAASFVQGGSLKAVLSVLKTPALLAVPPALLFKLTDLTVPLALERITGLLAAAMIPVMLVTLGVQLATSSGIRLNADTFISSGVRLIGGPVIALALAVPLGLSGLTRNAGVVQAGMPAAVFTAIIAMEYDLIPDFLTSTVLVSTLASTVTLTLLLTVI